MVSAGGGRCDGIETSDLVEGATSDLSERTAPSLQVFQIDEPFLLAARDRVVDKIPEAFVL